MIPLRTAAALLALTAAAAPVARGSGPIPPASDGSFEHHYRMVGKIRPLLFWISRDDIGGARLVRRRDWRGTTYELLIGTDPERAPRRVNQWGYFLEEVHGARATVLGLRTSSDEEDDTLEEAEKHAAEKTGVFGVMRGFVGATEAQAHSRTLRIERAPTFHQLDAILARIREDDGDWTVRSVARPDGVSPGFFTATLGLVDRSVEAHRHTGSPRPASSSIAYLYRHHIYDLRLREARFAENVRFRDRTFQDVVRGSFEVRNRTTGDTSRFQMAYGTQGELAGVPVHATFQPHWWLAIELILDEEVRFDPRN